MFHPPSPATAIAAALGLLHPWRVVLLCVTMTHEREHPALALLILVPLNHLLYKLTAGLDPSRRKAGPAGGNAGGMPGRSLPSAWWVQGGVVAGLHLLASIAVLIWYGSFKVLSSDVQAGTRTWQWWALVLTLIALNVLYRPLVRALNRLVGATGLLDSRLLSALFLAIAVWIWCDGVFAALYQQLSLYCDRSTVEWCEGGQVFSQSLARFVDAAYFSTITLSTTGFGDIVPLSDVARALVALEVITGFGLLGFLLSRVAGFVSPDSKPDEAGERKD
jgi:hypothetical protein